MHELNQPSLQIARFPGNAKCAVTTSWDDNTSDNMEIAKVLDSMNLKGTFYVDPGNPRWTNNGLTDSDLRTLSAQHDIGSHTWSHVDVRFCDPKTLRQELLRSKEHLEGISGRPVFGFAYPRGEHSTIAQRIVKECGYLFARTTYQGTLEFPPLDPYLWGISVAAAEMSARFLNQLISRTVLNHAGRMYVRNLAWDWRRLTSIFFRKVQVTNGVLHIFGHAWEVQKYARLRDQFIEVCRRISFRNDVWYTTNSRLFLNDLLRNNVQISHDQDSNTRSVFTVHTKRPLGISSGEYPIPLHVNVPKNWSQDFVVDVTTTSGKANIGKLEGRSWIDVYADEAKITVSRA